MKSSQNKENFLSIMTFISLCCYIFFDIVRRLEGNKFLTIIALMLVVVTILILLEAGIRKYTRKEFNIEFNLFKYLSLLLVNSFLVVIILVYYFNYK
jgi:hypothetical protein